MQVEQHGDEGHELDGEGEVRVGLVRAVKGVRFRIFGLMVHQLFVLLGRQNGELFAGGEGGDFWGIAGLFKVDIWEYGFGGQVVVVLEFREQELAAEFPAYAI